MATHASAGYQAAYGTAKDSNLLACTVQSAPCDPQRSQGCHSGVAPYPLPFKKLSSANVPCAHSPSSVAPLHAVPYRFRDHGLNNNGFPHTTRTLTYMTYSSALVWYLYSVVIAILQPDHRIAKQDLHRAVCAARIGGIVEQKRSILRYAVAREFPCEAILILGGFEIHGLCILLDNLGDQFDGVPPLAITSCGERDPFHTEIGLHLLVTLDVL